MAALFHGNNYVQPVNAALKQMLLICKYPRFAVNKCTRFKYNVTAVKNLFKKSCFVEKNALTVLTYIEFSVIIKLL